MKGRSGHYVVLLSDLTETPDRSSYATDLRLQTHRHRFYQTLAGILVGSIAFGRHMEGLRNVIHYELDMRSHHLRIDVIIKS